MKILIIFNHPYEGSFCAALRNELVKGITEQKNEVEVINLDKDNFNPVMTSEDLRNYPKGIVVDEKAKEYQEKIRNCDHLVFLFPIWWEVMPAMTKGFMDKVLTKGFACDIDENNQVPELIKLLHNIKQVTMITTMNTPADLYQKYFANAVEQSFINGTWGKMGYNTRWINYDKVKFVSKEQREEWLKDIYQFGKLIN
jgi:NAD(P)H dehydrogenase (quinone)